MKLEEIEVGRRFQTNYTKREGTVLHHGESGSSVKWHGTEGTKEITRKAKWGSKQDKPVTYTVAVPARVEVISSGTEVTLIGG